MNITEEHDAEHGVLLEGSYAVRKWASYVRYEWVQKSVEELQLDENVYGHHSIFPVHALTMGVNYDTFRFKQTRFALGTHFTFFSPDKQLAGLYGQKPISGHVYLRIFPGMMGTREGSFFLPY
jgi:hypothetical protein